MNNLVDALGIGIVRIRRLLSACTFSAGRRALRCGVLPCLVHQRVLRSIRPALVLDIGANRGQFTLDALRVDPLVEVRAFEPLSSEADVFRSAVGGLPNVVLDRRGLWSVSGSLPMHTSAAADSSSLLPISSLQVAAFPGTAASGEVQVDVVRLDDVLAPADVCTGRSLLKIDVQGGELEVLRGAGALLASIDWVYVELSLVEFYVGQPLASEVWSYLQTSGFELSDLGPVTRRGGRTVQFDALFERRSRFGRST
jgi:FkbM family methyltransferase